MRFKVEPLWDTVANRGKTLCAQLMDSVPCPGFDRIVSRYCGDARVLALLASERFCVVAHAQSTARESLRDIEVTLSAAIGVSVLVLPQR